MCVLNDYALGAWESLNYAIRVLQRHGAERALRDLSGIKEQLEAGVAVDFQRKMTAA